MDLGNSLGYKPLRNGSRNRYEYYFQCPSFPDFQSGLFWNYDLSICFKLGKTKWLTLWSFIQISHKLCEHSWLHWISREEVSPSPCPPPRPLHFLFHILAPVLSREKQRFVLIYYHFGFGLQWKSQILPTELKIKSQLIESYMMSLIYHILLSLSPPTICAFSFTV